MIYTNLKFGKHKGMTLPQIIINDPDWFFWAMHKGIFRGPLADEAKSLNVKARYIKIPGRSEDNPLVADYMVDPDSGVLEDMQIVHEDEYMDNHGVQTYRRKVIDIGYVTEISKKDKVGRELLKNRLKHYLFGSSKIRLTAKMCEKFFDDNSNFIRS